MRLDEWQKYLDAQFLDEEQQAKAAPVSRDKIATQPASGKKFRPSSLALDESMWVEDTPSTPVEPDRESAPPATENHAVRPSAPPGSVLPSRQMHDLLTPEERALLEAPLPPSPVPRTASLPQPRRQEALRPQPFGEPPALQADIPPFERYLPATHSAVQAEPATPTNKPPSREAATDGSPAHLPDGAFSVLIPMNSLPFQRPTVAPAAGTPPSAEAVDAPRRAPRSRARHARNVRPDYVPSGLSAAELWATVPKHVQTLLALGRMEEVEAEVAQSSYKRPFQQTRQELIERLLDPILSLEDTARLLNVCPTTVRRYTNKGILTYYRKEPDRPSMGGNPDKETRQRRFRLSDILAFLETQQAAIEADRQREERRSGSLPTQDEAEE
ncbi:MAG TPA: helix-turn-helix domain-containing protein [Chthonomonadaceae bacterium]|nr:helix-turn-helix domain-containing protein [Chthonomonadaceae bacterium]